MGTIVGVVVGYALGTRAGEQGWVELRDSWKVISTSEEVRDLFSGGFSVARDLLARGAEVLSEMMNNPNVTARLRPVA